AIALLLHASAAAAQISGLPPRDTPQALGIGTGTIRGRVVDGQTGRPLPRAHVTLQGPGALRPAAISDESGNFAFSALPTGLYRLIADRSTYLQGSYPDTR